jgi:hypothetical protein
MPDKKEKKSGGCCLVNLILGLLVTVLGGVAIWWLTTDPNSPLVKSTDVPPGEQSFLQQVAGNYVLDSWNEHTEPYTLYLDVLDGTLNIDSTGNASWRLSFDERGETHTPRPAVECKGRVSASSRQIEGVEGSNAIDWTSDIMSVDGSGVVGVHMAFCGWDNAPVQRENLGPFYKAPFDLAVQSVGGGTKILEMRNTEGTFTWRSR